MELQAEVILITNGGLLQVCKSCIYKSARAARAAFINPNLPWTDTVAGEFHYVMKQYYNSCPF